MLPPLPGAAPIGWRPHRLPGATPPGTYFTPAGESARAMIFAAASGAPFVRAPIVVPADIRVSTHPSLTSMIRRSLRAVFVAAGLEPIEISYLFPEMPPAALFRRLTDDVAEPGEDASFPSFAQLVGRVRFSLTRATTKMRSPTPFGVSVVAALRRRLDDLSGMEE